MGGAGWGRVRGRPSGFRWPVVLGQRPVGGGREWDARGPVRLATPAERLSADVARANARSRGEAL
ncbi:hypothetical protein ABZ366_17145 [Streptomyces sp. NPDC005904]|uniref:hypothetical protein n=1 Tax=Streptomyces sp. NPDC005904 TaxID=3154570 RepID=UPI0033ED35D9